MLETEAVRLDREGLLALARKWLSLLGGLDADGRRDIPALLLILTEDIDYRIPFVDPPARFIGHNAFCGFMESMQGLFAEISYDVETMYADIEAQTAVFEMTSFRLVLPERVPYSNRYVFRMTARNGRVSEIMEYVNPIPALELSQRLNLTAR